MFNDRYQEEKSRCGLHIVFLKISNGFSGVFPLKQLWESLKNNFMIGVFQKVYSFDSLLQNFYPLCSVSSHSWNLVTIESLSYHASNHIGIKIMILYVLKNPLSRLDCKLAIILCQQLKYNETTSHFFIMVAFTAASSIQILPQ